ncbi:MAG: gluconate 2-dehydrogenase subunit 3 family protein [Gemmatimonadaceae bacterium]|nr:gluconate 2-dehydrogenase subunit 3 family protein [Gemmatimonadaceae bacterium]
MTAVDRRDFLRVAGGSAAALWLAHWPLVEAAAAEAQRVAATGEACAFTALSSAQAAALDAFAARIIPTDDLPGAREDGAAGAGRTFASLTPEAQDEIMRTLEREVPDAFGAARFAVLCGTFANSSYGGNRDEAGWRILGFEHRPVWTKPYGWYDAPENLGRE